MLNAATLIVGIIVFAVIAISAYFTFRSLRRGGCSYCSGCKETSCDECQKKD
jgi:hypothetical protein